jgi:hypothetical protein
MFLSIDWAFNDKKLLLNSSLGLQVLDLASGEITHEITPDLPSYGSSWSTDNIINYSVFDAEKWQVHQYNLETKHSQTLDEKWAFVLANNSDTVFINQQMKINRFAQNTSLSELCAPLISRFSFNVRFTRNGFYCPAKENHNTLIHVDNDNNIRKIEKGIYQTPFYAVTDNLVANIELKDSVSDIMRTQF